MGFLFFVRVGFWKRNFLCGVIKFSVYKMVDLLYGKNILDKLLKWFYFNYFGMAVLIYKGILEFILNRFE